MKNIIIVGAGEFGQEISEWLEDIIERDATIRIGGYLDDGLAVVDKLNDSYPYPLLGKIANYYPRDEDFFVIAIGNPAVKMQVVNCLKQRSANFFNLIHPSVVIARTATLGTGVIMCPFSLASVHCVIEDFVTINAYSSIGHNAYIGEGVTISSHVDITGNVRVNNGVFIGSNASVLPSVEIGIAAKIGAGSMVLKKVSAYTTTYTLPVRSLLNDQ